MKKKDRFNDLYNLAKLKQARHENAIKSKKEEEEKALEKDLVFQPNINNENRSELLR